MKNVENREYKSDVFSMLMEDKRYALEVYNALNGSSYEDPEQVEYVNLEKGISLSVRNDAAFIVDTDVSIYEHQSSYNPNMPLRALIYFVDIIREHVIKKRDLFSHNPIRIPVPHFAVFYNGTINRPEKEILKLSDSYNKPTEKPELELTCTVYNINSGIGDRLLESCKVLEGYTVFVEKVREYKAEGKDKPIEKAMDHCIENHILEEFFAKRWTEVLNVMTIDMTFERREVLIREEEYENGRAEGKAEGKAEGISIGDFTRLASLIQKKIIKGKPLETIANELESTVDEIRPIYDEVSKYPTDTDTAKIYEEIHNKNQS